jgi:hypothetical protein
MEEGKGNNHKERVKGRGRRKEKAIIIRKE